MIGKIFDPKLKIRPLETDNVIPVINEVTTYQLSDEELEKYRVPNWQPKELNRKLAQSTSTKECCVNGCNRKSRARKMCQYHYDRFRIYGDPLFKKRELP